MADGLEMPTHHLPVEDKGPHPSGMEMDSLRQYFMDFPDSVFVVGIEGKIEFLNRSAEKLFGLDLREGSQIRCSDVLRIEIDGKESDLLQSCLESSVLDHIPVRVRHRDGGWLYRFATASLKKDSKGQAIGCLVILRDNRNESQSESELQTRVAVLSSILKNFPTPFFTVDSNLVVTYMNENLQRLTGYSKKEVVNRLHCSEVLSTPQCDTSGCLLKRAMETKQSVSGARHTIRNRDGKTIPVVIYASIITDADQNVVGGFEAIRDISPIIEAEEKIQLLTEMTQEGILMADERYRIIYTNSRMAEISGRSKEELLGTDVRELLPSQHVELMSDFIRKAAQKQQVRFCSTIQPDSLPASDSRTFEICVASVQVGKGVLTCFYFRDLSAHIEREQELRKANSFLQNIIQSSVSGIVVVDTEGKILIFNEGAERILGYKSEEVVGHPQVLFHFYEAEVAREIMRRMRGSEYGPRGKLLTTRVTFTRKDGQPVPVNLSAALIKEGDKDLGSVGIFSDLTEEYKMRKELEDARNQLFQAEKIASLGRLSAGVAHEINNPLAGILIYADLLMRDVGENLHWKKDLDEIINQTLRCKQIVNRLLEFSRQPLGQRVAFDPNDVVERCLELLGHQPLFHDVHFVKELKMDLPMIVGDPSQIQQVFTNLIINAANAMEGRGGIRISSSFNETSSEVVFSFADTGPGIPDEIKDKVFEPFFTTKRPREGTGLGLSVVYGIVQQHGGSVKVDDAPGGGALFTITLPLEPPENQTDLSDSGSQWLQY